MKSKQLIAFLVLLLKTITTVGQGCFLNSSPSSLGQTTKFSGNPNLDQINTQEYYYLVQKFGVSPDIFYLHDGKLPNAYATPQISNPNFPDGTVLIGFSLIQQECLQSPSGTCSSIPIVMAHEFAHIVDFKYGTGLNGKYKELFADYLAGCYMYFRSVEFKITFVQEAALSFFQKGDYSFNSPVHHGTPYQRYNCLMTGYQYAYNYSSQGQFLSLQTVVNSAIQYVKQF
jgi:hypothetical protein